MKFIHTADWHLGRVFLGVHLLDDQRHVMMQFLDVVKDEKPDAVIVAGDIYDRAVPPPEAVELLDEILCKLVLELQTTTVIIAGNHDSPGRLQFGSRLFAQRRLHVAGTMRGTCLPVQLEDAHGRVLIHLIPFAEPGFVRQRLDDPEIVDHNSAMRKLTDHARAVGRPGERSIIVAHAYVAGGQSCESERPLSVGSAGMVELACFNGFSYAALGHLHRPQRLGNVHYSGSPMKYSFDEAEHEKGVAIVEMDDQGECTIRHVPLSPRRDVRRIGGTMTELLAGGERFGCKEDYLDITIADPGPVSDAIGRLRQAFPNVLHIGRTAAETTGAVIDRPDVRRLDARALFRRFFAYATNTELDAEQEQIFVQAVDAANAMDYEAPAGQVESAS